MGNRLRRVAYAPTSGHFLSNGLAIRGGKGLGRGGEDLVIFGRDMTSVEVGQLRQERLEESGVFRGQAAVAEPRLAQIVHFAVDSLGADMVLLEGVDAG